MSEQDAAAPVSHLHKPDRRESLTRRMVLLMVCVAVAPYALAVVWPIHNLLAWGDSYQDGLAALPRSFGRVWELFLMWLFLGCGLLLGVIVIGAFVWKRRGLVALTLVVVSVLAIFGGRAMAKRSRFVPTRFLEGFRDHVKATVDFAALRTWAARLKDKPNDEIPAARWPPALPKIEAQVVFLNQEPNGPRILLICWGGAWGSWSLAIGPKDMKIQPIPPDFVVCEVEPGVMVGYGSD